jgi:hypothetical protein
VDGAHDCSTVIGCDETISTRCAHVSSTMCHRTEFFRLHERLIRTGGSNSSFLMDPINPAQSATYFYYMIAIELLQVLRLDSEFQAVVAVLDSTFTSHMEI